MILLVQSSTTNRFFFLDILSSLDSIFASLGCLSQMRCRCSKNQPLHLKFPQTVCCHLIERLLHLTVFLTDLVLITGDNILVCFFSVDLRCRLRRLKVRLKSTVLFGFMRIKHSCHGFFCIFVPCICFNFFSC